VVAAAGSNTNTADMMAEAERLGEDFQLFVAPVVIKIFLPFMNGAGRARTQAVPAGPAISWRRGIYSQGEIRKDRN
jgi:hypothetical protein